MYKICNKCKEEKLITEFNKHKHHRDGYQSNCKICIKKHKDSKKSEICEYRKKYYEENKTELTQQQKQYQKEYKEVNKAKIAEYQINYRRINKSEIIEQQKQYQSANRGRINAIGAKRRAIKLQSTPIWLTDAELIQIRQYYIDAHILEVDTGNKYHVDHIVPLQGKNVCGLHVPWNLQVIPAKENLQKSNKLEKEYYDVQKG